MYLLSHRAFYAMKEDLSNPFSEVQDLDRRGSRSLNDSDNLFTELSADFSEITRETLKTLRGKNSYGLSYDKLYAESMDKGEKFVASGSLKRDVAYAMAYRAKEDGDSFGTFDGVAIELFQHCFERFEGTGDMLFSLANDKRNYFNFATLRDVHFWLFLEADGDFSRKLQLRFQKGKSIVELQLDIGPSGNASWNTRGLSAFKRSHQALCDELRAVVEDFHQRKEWMKEYLEAKPKPGLNSAQIAQIKRILEIFFDRTVDLSALKPGIVLTEDPIILEARARGFIGRCERCEKIVALEPFNALRGDGPIDWKDESKLYRNSYAESAIKEILTKDHRSSCSGAYYISSRTGQRELI